MLKNVEKKLKIIAKVIVTRIKQVETENLKYSRIQKQLKPNPNVKTHFVKMFCKPFFYANMRQTYKI